MGHHYEEWLDGQAVDLNKQVAELKSQLESCRKSNASLRKQLEAHRRDESRRFRDQQDYVPYGDDDYDR